VKAKGMDIVQHEDTWAYTDGRRFGIQIQGQVYPAENYGIGDVVGIFLNLDDNEVSFYKNQALQQKPLTRQQRGRAKMCHWYNWCHCNLMSRVRATCEPRAYSAQLIRAHHRKRLANTHPKKQRSCR